jgi:hypothetical protein
VNDGKCTLWTPLASVVIVPTATAPVVGFTITCETPFELKLGFNAIPVLNGFALGFKTVCGFVVGVTLVVGVFVTSVNGVPKPVTGLVVAFTDGTVVFKVVGVPVVLVPVNGVPIPVVEVVVPVSGVPSPVTGLGVAVTDGTEAVPN